jgi:DNA-binding XRE family transcriptional regulator
MALKDLRIKEGMTQAELAKKLEVDQTAVSNWEKGKNPPLPKYRKKLCRIFRCEEADL